MLVLVSQYVVLWLGICLRSGFACCLVLTNSGLKRNAPGPNAVGMMFLGIPDRLLSIALPCALGSCTSIIHLVFYSLRGARPPFSGLSAGL